MTDRPTLPPSPEEAAELAAFERSLREQGEGRARLENTVRRLPVRRMTPVPESRP